MTRNQTDVPVCRHLRMREAVVALFAAATFLVLFAGSPHGVMPIGPESARAATVSSPEWWPLRGSNKVGCARNSSGGVCGGNYHGVWAIDVEGPTGQNVYASGSGIASVYSNTTACSGYGRAVVVDHGGHGKSLYAHLSSINISNGQQVTPNTVIGKLGGTGFTQPCGYAHLHYEETAGSFWNGARDPGPLKACIGNRLTSYPNEWGRGSWNGLPGHTYTAKHDGMGCSGNNPTGSFDEASSPQAGVVRVRGWAFDRDDVSAQIPIHIYVGGQAGTGSEGHNIGPAKTHRPDVHRVHGTGTHHGFETAITTSRIGSQQVCAYAINIGSGNNVLLGCKAVQVGNPNPVGSFDSIESPEPGVVRVRGWTFDRSSKTTPLDIHVYIGPDGNREGHSGFPKASVSRPDVNKAFPGVGNNHGYDQRIVTKKTGRQRVCVFGINIGVGSNAPIGCRETTIADPNPHGTFDSVVSEAPGRIRVRGWTIDPSAPSRPTAVHVYVGGRYGSGAAGHNIGMANVLRADVGRVFPGAGNYHGFDKVLPTKSSGDIPVCAYAINIGIGSNRELTCKTVSVARDVVPPVTRITRGVSRRLAVRSKTKKLKFKFKASEDFASFQCQLNSGKWFACKSGVKVKVRATEKWRSHKFTVRSIDYAGNRESRGAKAHWRIRRK